jgi:hypothetical protein
MIDQNSLSENHTSIFPDLSLCDIDIDFELNDGKGAWVVVLRKDGHSRQPLPDLDGNM